MQRLKQLAKIIIAWQNNKHVFSKTHKKPLTDKIDSIDKLEAQNMISNTESEKRSSLKTDLTELEQKEALYQSQRAKRLWIKEGDENLMFFHRAYSM